MKLLAVLLPLAFATSVYGHSYLTIPSSRTRLGNEASICHSQLLSLRITTDHQFRLAKIYGPSAPSSNQYRLGQTSPPHQLAEAVPAATTLESALITINQATTGAPSPGQAVDVQWCVDNNGDHGGMFSYRICQYQTLVDKFITPGYLPASNEKQAAEDCFEAGTLKRTDVDGQHCSFSPDCTEGQACWRNDWFTCNAFRANAWLPGC
jgi:hypothetical protein